MNARVICLAFTTLALLAGAIGALTSPPARAVTSYGLYVNPGGSSNALTCGWNCTCV